MIYICRAALGRAFLLAMSLVPSFGLAQHEVSSERSVSNYADVVEQCKTLGTADFSQIQDAPTEVTDVKFVGGKGALPGYCAVQGFVAPKVGFELRLPSSNWNQKFVEVGCGGTCGFLVIESCDGPLKRGYACITTDMGHKGTGWDGMWGYNDLQAQIDFGYRATHVAALAGKAITEQFYKKVPGHSYFMGCSTGGRQGMMEAQRFPEDFNGIVAGSPVISTGPMILEMLGTFRTLTDNDAKPLLSVADAKLVHYAAIAKCDLNDGVKDGVIGNPPSCKFDPAGLICATGKKNECLSQEQAAAVKKLYSGLSATRDESTLTGFAMPGSELSMGGPGVAAVSDGIRDFMRYFTFMPAPGPLWQLKDFDPARDYRRFGLLGSLLDATNPDLRKFKAAGGKLISYAGWNEGAPLPLNIDYYDTVEKTMGGRVATQAFYRFFAVPGMNHCAGGDGAFAIDYLRYIETWVEQGQAPDQMVGAHVANDNHADWESFPLDSSKITFTRPVYPYPLQAKYQGSGNPNDAANFKPAHP